MIAPALLLVAALAAPAQDAARRPQRPAELVAARVRSVLRSNSDDAWLDLADALPELALEGGADLTSTFEAAHLAEQAGSTAGRATQPSTWRGVRAMRAWAASITPTQLVTFVLAVLTLSMVTVTSLRRRGGQVTSVRPRSQPPGMHRSRVTARFSEARQLASAGVAVPEIARRTGMARDAVTLLVGLRSR